MAISSTAIFQVRSTGVDTSGGGYVAGGGGTDFSQQNSPQGNGTNLTVDPTVNTKIIPDGYTVVAADVGNIIQITTTGTGAVFTLGFYQIVTATPGTTLTQRWTLDRSPAIISSIGAVWAMGGALLTIAKAQSGAVSGNTINTNNITSALTSSINVVFSGLSGVFRSAGMQGGFSS